MTCLWRVQTHTWCREKEGHNVTGSPWPVYWVKSINTHLAWKRILEAGEFATSQTPQPSSAASMALPNPFFRRTQQAWHPLGLRSAALAAGRAFPPWKSDHSSRASSHASCFTVSAGRLSSTVGSPWTPTTLCKIATHMPATLPYSYGSILRAEHTHHILHE